MTDSLVQKVSVLKDRVAAAKVQAEEAKVKRAILQDRLDVLNEKLRELLGHVDWTKAQSMLESVTVKAEQALEYLAEALDGVDIDLDE